MFGYTQLFRSLLASAAVVAAMLLTACADGGSVADSNASPFVQPKKATVILVFGDSTSQGYGYEKFGTYYEDVPPGKMYADLLRNRLKAEKIDAFAPVTVINESLGSEFAFESISRLSYVLAVYKPTHVLLAHGTNDARAQIPLSDMSNNFITMINMVRNSGAKPLLADMTLTVYGKDYGDAYSKMVRDTAFIAAATYVPIVENIIYKPQYVLNDGYGYHYNETAQPLMMINVWNKLIPLLE
jgi:acyl-CoA thioesterase I